jgi:hypothetical protein
VAVRASDTPLLDAAVAALHSFLPRFNLVESNTVEEPFSASVAAVVHLLQQQLHLLHLNFMCIF